jgi:cytochrome oxidase Cu insertion factor (SCO1/SenC/PrrC family)
MRSIGPILALALSLALPAAAQRAPGAAPPAAATVEVSTLGPQAGTRAPEFTLPDQDGKPRTLASLAGPNGTMLVFSRSADW